MATRLGRHPYFKEIVTRLFFKSIEIPPDAFLFYDKKVSPPPFSGPSFALDIAEELKHLATVEALWSKLEGATRKTPVVALGGGTLLDLVGFAAATYMRGLDTLYVPTTLLAMVDAAYGGKTGFNYKGRKNLIGARHPPREIWIDLAYLETLPKREFNSGMAEVIKYAIAFDASFMEMLEGDFSLSEVVRKCLEFKRLVVEQDPLDQGVRKLLNLGHTFAHALESETEYRVLTHGEAVAYGLLWSSQFLLSPLEQKRIERLLHRYHLLPPLPPLDPEKLLFWMKQDKKNEKGKVTLVLPERIGKAALYETIEEQALIDFFQKKKR